jgi:release factor glutamine methyltransferase
MMSNHLLTVRQAEQKGKELLSKIPEINCSLESAILLAYTLQKDRAWLFAWPEKMLSEQQQQAFENHLNRRLSGEPVSYITGHREFWNLDLKVTTDTLIPRPETELLVETALEKINESNANIIELGTGTGAIAAALATEKPAWQITATDFNATTLQTARENFSRHELIINTVQSDWFKNIPDEKYHLVISNPPYIEANDPHLKQGDLRFEPISALASGKDGLDAIREITEKAHQHLITDGWLMLEHGYNQGQAVFNLFLLAGFTNIQTLTDLSGNDRITIGQLL